MPTSKTPSFPLGLAIFGGFFTTGDYIREQLGLGSRAGCARGSNVKLLYAPFVTRGSPTIATTFMTATS
jgi:hypothetical protein